MVVTRQSALITTVSTIIIMLFTQAVEANQAEYAEEFHGILQSVKGHCDLIRTGTGNYKMSEQTFKTDGSYFKTEWEGEWVYWEDRWKITSVGMQEFIPEPSGAPITNKINRIYEFQGNISLFYDLQGKSGVLMEADESTKEGLFFAGVTSCVRNGQPINQYAERLTNGQIAIKSINLTEPALVKVDIQYLDENNIPYSTGEIVFDSAKQYSIVEHRVEGISSPINHENRVEMRQDKSSGIYFPQKALFKDVNRATNTTISILEITFENTQLNVDVKDEDVAINIPPGIVIQDMIRNTLYQPTVHVTTFEDVVSGKLISQTRGELIGTDTSLQTDQGTKNLATGNSSFRLQSLFNIKIAFFTILSVVVFFGSLFYFKKGN